MAEYLKRGKPAEAGGGRREGARHGRGHPGDIEARGDAAVRGLSEKFDGYAPRPSA
jgi:sulfopropanediol 3-dehydrogenase